MLIRSIFNVNFVQKGGKGGVLAHFRNFFRVLEGLLSISALQHCHLGPSAADDWFFLGCRGFGVLMGISVDISSSSSEF